MIGRGGFYIWLLALLMDGNELLTLVFEATGANNKSAVWPWAMKKMPVPYRLESDCPLIHVILSTGVEFKIASHIFSKLFLGCK